MQKKKLSTGAAKEILKNNGFKITLSRLAVLDVFVENHKPLDANFVFNKLNKKFNEVTIYRIISCFEKSGILKKVVSGSQKFKNIKDHSLELFGYCKTCN